MIRKLPIFIILWGISLVATGQFAIDEGDMPTSPEQYPISLGALGPTTPPLEKAGKAVIWDYTDMDRVGQRVDSFFEVDDTPLAYRFNFDDPFTPAYLADHALKRPDASSSSISFPIQIEDRYDYYKKKNSGYELLGFGARINGLPASAKFDPKDTVHHFPLNYGNIDSSYAKLVFDQLPGTYYEQERWRYDTVDGEGTVHTPFGVFDCLRIKTRLRIRDSLKSDSLGVETASFRPTEIIYRWVAEDKGVPVLSITERGGTETSVEYLDTLETSSVQNNAAMDQEGLELYPVPAEERLFIEGGKGEWERFELYSIRGQLLKDGPMNSKQRSSIDVSDLPSGVHVLQVMGKKGVWSERVMIGE